MGGIGMGGQGRGDLGGFLGFPFVQVVAVCDVVGRHAQLAKDMVDQRYGNKDCRCTSDFNEITRRPDIDAVLIGTPDHWHAVISIEAMKHGKDVYCEKPETLTVREGRRMVEIARQYGRIFSGGSQRVWGDYHWFHQMVRGGAIGDVKKPGSTSVARRDHAICRRWKSRTMSIGTCGWGRRPGVRTIPA
jgi:predicted dehydrogenase